MGLRTTDCPQIRRALDETTQHFRVHTSSFAFLIHYDHILFGKSVSVFVSSRPDDLEAVELLEIRNPLLSIQRKRMHDRPFRERLSESNEAWKIHVQLVLKAPGLPRANASN